MTTHPASPDSADLDAARLLLARMGLTPADLLALSQDRPPIPTFAEYIPVVAAAVGDGTRRVYGSYWNRILDCWGDRRLTEPSPSEIRQLVANTRANVVLRRNGRDGRSAGEHLIAALRCLYHHAEEQAAAELVRLAKEQGLSLTGPDGLLKALTKTVLETALGEEMTEHLGYEKHGQAAAGNVRNGTRSKSVLTEHSGPVQIEVPRDRAGTFSPQIVKKRQRRLSGVDEVVLSLYAKGLTTGEISAHFTEIYGASVSKETISRITDKVLEEMNEWSVRPLDEIYAAVFIDAIVVEVRDGQVANRPVYAAIGVTLDGERDILGLWGGEGAKFWMAVLTEIRNRGVKDVFFLVCDGLKGLPEVVGNVWPATIVQTCIIHLIRNTFRLASRRDWDALKRLVKPIYTAVNATAARAAFDELAEAWGQRYPAIVRLWENAWEEFIPFLDYDTEIRRVICSTNAIESLNARYRRAIKARGHFPSEQAALKCLYLVTRSLDPTGQGRARWTMRWKPALNAFAVTFSDRFPAAETY